MEDIFSCLIIPVVFLSLSLCVTDGALARLRGTDCTFSLCDADLKIPTIHRLSHLRWVGGRGLTQDRLIIMRPNNHSSWFCSRLNNL